MISSGNGNDRLIADRDSILSVVRGKSILITGAGGFIGSAVARAMVKLPVEQLVLLDIAEAGLHELSLQIDAASETPYALLVGDVCDSALLGYLFERYRPQIVLHAAACKHVALMEQNPFAAARSNVLGSWQIASGASAFGAEQLIVISTDKAVAPAGIMGATKRVVELMVLANRTATRMKAVRLGNVFGSTGSVVPILREQIARGGPLTITDPTCERYFVSIDDAVRWLVLSCLSEHPAAVLVPKAGEPRRILDLAQELVESSGVRKERIEYQFTGLRAGEKLRERMISDEELVLDAGIAGLQRVEAGDLPVPEFLYQAIEEIGASVRERDLERLLRSIMSIVPEYKPSACLQRQVEYMRSTRA